jgi:hypothetical protein
VPYHERVQPSLPLLVFAALAGGSFGLILLPLSTLTAAAVATGLGAATVALALLASPRIDVDAAGLRAGSARIEPEFLGEVSVLDRERLRAVLGVEADARAHLCHRAYAAGAVKVGIVDPRDPTPYWVVSTNRPDELASALIELVRSRP